MFNLKKDLIIIDVETSGVSDNASIIQLGAVKFDSKGFWHQIPEFIACIIPYTGEWSKEAEAIHKIKQDNLFKYGHRLETVLKWFEEWAGNYKNFHLAQWACGFDTRMLQLAYQHINRKYPFSYRAFDIASIVRFSFAYKGILSKKCSLGDCAKKIGLDVDKNRQHNALYDAQLTAQVLETIIGGINEL